MPYSVDIGEPTARQFDATMIRFGFLGQVARVKGVDLVIRAFRQLNRTRTRARLNIHGKLNANDAYLRELERLTGNDADIHFSGAYVHEDLRKILSDLDVVVVPSRWYENSPHVILEAFAAKRPVIGTNVGGVAEIVQHNVNGLLFERGNVADLARQMQRILDDIELLPRLRAAIPSVRTPDEEMDDILKVYAQTIAARQPMSITFSEEHV
jgi:glycosyltransferase involved in cell wall biosynthesis